MIKTYRGRGLEELRELAPISGRIERSTGEWVAEVEFTVENSQLILRVNGREYSSITNALHELAPELATHAADGSEGSGNIANNIIGNYNILKNVILGTQSMAEIVGTGSRTAAPSKTRFKRPALPAVKIDSDLPARGNLYSVFAREEIVKIAQGMGGAEQFQNSLEGLTLQQFAEQHGLELAA